MIEAASGTGDAITARRRCARGRDANRAELDRRVAERRRPTTPCSFIYTSGTTGPPKGCVLTHGNCRAICDMVTERGIDPATGDVAYLFLPLAHVFAR